MDKKKRLILIIVSVVLVLAVVQPLPAGATNWINTVLARQPEADRSTAGSLNGVYIGQVKLEYAVGGVYSDSLQPPEPDGEALPELGTIDLGLQLTQSEAGVAGYVDLGHTLVFTTEHTLDSIGFGPSITGSFDGSSLTLESERVSLVSAGQPMMRQFRLEGSVSQGDVSQLNGEYRETVWGYGLQPLTIVGTFSLNWSTPPAERHIYLPVIRN